MKKSTPICLAIICAGALFFLNRPAKHSTETQNSTSLASLLFNNSSNSTPQSEQRRITIARANKMGTNLNTVPNTNMDNNGLIRGKTANNGMSLPGKMSSQPISSNTYIADSSDYAPPLGESTPIIYISDNDANQIFSCTNNTQGNTLKCHIAINNLFGPQNILVIEQKLYILNIKNSNITVCNINSVGTLVNCSNTLLPISNPVHFYYDQQQLYISDFGVKQVIRCDLDNNGDLSSCDRASNIYPALFSTVNLNGYNYSTNYFKNAINKCINMYSDACTLIKDPTIKGPLTFAVYNNQAYIVNAINSSAYNISACNIQSNGDLSDCHIVVNNLPMPIGIAGYTTQ